MKNKFKSWFTPANLKEVGTDTIYDIIGSILYGIGIYTFASNANFAPGGIAGVTIIIHHFLPWVPIGAGQLVINIPVAIICFKLLGKKFFIKSVRSMVISSFFLDFVMPQFPMYGGERLLAAIFAGVLSGAGLALIYMRGSSTGGTDFIIMAIRKKLPHMSIGSISLAIDGSVILAGGLIEPQASALAAKLHINRECLPYRIFRIVRTLIVIFVGELFFRANGLPAGIAMFGQMVGNFTLDSIVSGAMFKIGLSQADLLAASVFALLVFASSIAREHGHNILEIVAEKRFVIRWGFWLLLFFAIVVFGAYGVGYVPIDPMYAQF